MPVEHLSDYERAICYHTIPRVTQPLTFGLIVVYTVCLVEAIFLLAYGFATKNSLIETVGIWSLAGIVALGIVAFLTRAFLNELKQRRALAAARNVPDPIVDIGDIPDPFADHLLLRHPLHTRGDLFPCTDEAGNLMYFVESSPNSPWWKVKDPHDTEILRVRVESTRGASFLLSETRPSRLAVYEGDALVARVRRRLTLASPALIVECSKPEPHSYLFTRDAIYREKRIVGRIYYMHRSLYLDIRKDAFHNAILALFVTMT